jgi:hypothetical protein
MNTFGRVSFLSCTFFALVVNEKRSLLQNKPSAAFYLKIVGVETGLKIFTCTCMNVLPHSLHFLVLRD